MADQEQQILANELAKIGAKGEKRAGKLAGIPEALQGFGGSLGARLASNYLPTERFQLETRIAVDARTILAKAYAFLATNGRIVNDEEAGASQYPKISGVVGSGMLRMNPAILHAEVITIDEDGCTVLISGAAKEGLIKQHTAKKAVNRLLDRLRDLTKSSG